MRFNTIKIVILELIEEEIEENADGRVWKYSFSSDNRCWKKVIESNLRWIQSEWAFHKESEDKICTKTWNSEISDDDWERRQVCKGDILRQR
jgi:hypothetical protein